MHIMSKEQLSDFSTGELHKRKMPTQKPGHSVQTYGTPWEFIKAVENRFGKIICDLAASKENTKAEKFYDEAANSLTQPWSQHYPDGNLWINPPYGNIRVWVEKCATESANRHGSILLLVPASIGSGWFADHVHNKAMVLGLSPRIIFEGETTPFPKDLMLCIYSNGLSGFDVWRWRP